MVTQSAPACQAVFRASYYRSRNRRIDGDLCISENKTPGLAYEFTNDAVKPTAQHRNSGFFDFVVKNPKIW
jgi:hypothetical protein